MVLPSIHSKLRVPSTVSILISEDVACVIASLLSCYLTLALCLQQNKDHSESRSTYAGGQSLATNLQHKSTTSFEHMSSVYIRI